MNWFLGCVIFAALSIARAATEPLLDKVDVFTAGTDGYALYRIPGVVVTKRGTVLAYCEARRTGKNDWDAIDILLCRSSDAGKSWSAPQKIAEVPGPKSRNPVIAGAKFANPGDITYNNPVAIPDAHGAVHFLFCLEYMRCFYVRSEDDGVTWSRPIEITSVFEQFRRDYDWKVLATGPGHGIQLKSGRLLVPVWLSLGTGSGGHRPSVTATIFSDDGGKSWQRGDIAVPNTEEWINPNEAAAVELADGSVMLNVRSESKSSRRLVTTSKDGATGWSKPRFDDALLEPICMASIARVPGGAGYDRSLIVFANPHTLSRADGKDAPGVARDRRNLSIKLSYDAGETWPVDKVLEPGFSGYSDLAVAKDGTILCFFERGSTDGKSNTRTGYLTLARFKLEWLKGRNELR